MTIRPLFVSKIALGLDLSHPLEAVRMIAPNHNKDFVVGISVKIDSAFLSLSLSPVCSRNRVSVKNPVSGYTQYTGYFAACAILFQRATFQR